MQFHCDATCIIRPPMALLFMHCSKLFHSENTTEIVYPTIVKKCLSTSSFFLLFILLHAFFLSLKCIQDIVITPTRSSVDNNIIMFSLYSPAAVLAVHCIHLSIREL